MTTNAPTVPFHDATVSLLWADPNAAAEVADMHATCFDKSWDFAEMEALLAHPAAMSLVCKVRPSNNGAHPKNAGFVLGQLAADEAEILSIGVLPGFRRRGLAQRMMEGVMRAARLAEAKRLVLEVSAANAAASALYGQLDFETVGRRERYYTNSDGTKSDALILARTL